MVYMTHTPLHAPMHTRTYTAAQAPTDLWPLSLDLLVRCLHRDTLSGGGASFLTVRLSMRSQGGASATPQMSPDTKRCILLVSSAVTGRRENGEVRGERLEI